MWSIFVFFGVMLVFTHSSAEKSWHKSVSSFSMALDNSFNLSPVSLSSAVMTCTCRGLRNPQCTCQLFSGRLDCTVQFHMQSAWCRPAPGCTLSSRGRWDTCAPSQVGTCNVPTWCSLAGPRCPSTACESPVRDRIARQQQNERRDAGSSPHSVA